MSRRCNFLQMLLDDKSSSDDDDEFIFKANMKGVSVFGHEMINWTEKTSLLHIMNLVKAHDDYYVQKKNMAGILGYPVSKR
uniref:Uncharacterized protein n=1 Tax=Oryza meridionalis TaxID=40149 RepID=A0A0E0CKL1_9ORYZ